MLGKHSTQCATSTAQTRGFLEDPREGSEIQNSHPATGLLLSPALSILASL